MVLDNSGHASRPSAAALNQFVGTDTEQTASAFAGQDRKVVMLENPPVVPPKFDPPVCLALAKFVEICRFISNTTPTNEETIYRALADDRRIYDLDIDRLICPVMPICDPIVDGIPVRLDATHIRPECGVAIADQMFTALRDSGALRD